MANHKSAKKRIRQNVVSRDRNRAVRSSVRTVIKKVQTAIEKGDTKEAQELLREAESGIQRAASHGAYHKKTASRKVSRLHAAVKAASASAS